ncbi:MULTISPECIES: hypothetical protein [unclassified Nocardioides]|uniref:hypothetical protein n=1 Tax=unclassified Nocardioides TaxID=2615069 RepID=UPI00360B7D66
MASSDFDFLTGSWHVDHEKLVDPFGPADGATVRFRSEATVWPILDGLGNADETRGTLPDGSSFVGFSLRLHEPDADQWQIWWASKARPGVLDDPVRGGFTGDEGVFVGPAEHDGREFLARFRWLDTSGDHPVWEQDFSFDDGRSWEPVNWRMVHTRASTT